MDLTALRISSPFSSFSSIILRYCPKSFSLSSLSLSKSPRNSQIYTLKVDTSCRASKDSVVFDDAAYEAARLSLDAKARESMAEASEREVTVGVGVKQVLRYAPRSVGILVDRGFGSTRISRSSVSINIAVVFIGGKDDREALPFAGRMARHPGVKLSVIRFLFDLNKESSVSTRL